MISVCIRDQLTRVLQQIKSERGTMAGMSIDDLTQQVAQRLVQNQKPVHTITSYLTPSCCVFIISFVLCIAHILFSSFFYFIAVVATRAYSTTIWSKSLSRFGWSNSAPCCPAATSHAASFSSPGCSGLPHKTSTGKIQL